MTLVRATAAALALICGETAYADTEAAKPTSPCQAIVDRFGAQKGWWWSSIAWRELESIPARSELAWQPPLGGGLDPDPFRHYLVAHPIARRCYMAVCGGFANTCRFLEPPDVAGNVE